MAMTEKERTSFRHRALRVIEGLTVARDMWKAYEDHVRMIPISYFQNISLELIYGDDEWWIFPPEETVPSVLWPIDVCAIAPTNGSGSGDDFDFNLAHITSTTARACRGKARVFSPFMVRHVHCGIDGNFNNRATMRATGGVASYAALIGKRWVYSSSRQNWQAIDRPKEVYARDTTIRSNGINPLYPNIAIGIALRHRYEWSVTIGYDDGPSVRVACDPTAIKDLLKYREFDPASMRRKTLMTWVSDHWRKIRTDSDVEGYVRNYLRGTNVISWHGLIVTINAPEYDLEREIQLIEDRAGMRRDGADRRSRLAGAG